MCTWFACLMGLFDDWLLVVPSRVCFFDNFFLARVAVCVPRSQSFARALGVRVVACGHTLAFAR